MVNSSDEESDISDSDIAEYKEKTCAQLRAGKMKVKHGERAFRCPFCPGKMKQDYNLKDLLQHATGIGAAHKRTAKVRATHLGLAKYLEKDLASSLEKPLQIVLYKPKTPEDEEEKFVWPWMGIVVNLLPQLMLTEFPKESEDWLRAQFSRFRPLQVTILKCANDQTFCAVIRFSKQWSGFKDASAFENHFVAEKYGKVDWSKINCRKDDLYGLEATDRRVAYYARQIEEKNKHLGELELENNKNAMKLERMMEEKDRLVEDHNKKILKMQSAACKSSRKVIDENLKLHEELHTRRKEIDRRLIYIIRLIGYILQAETDAALENLKELEMKLTSKHKLELEIEQLKGKLEVMKHMGAEEDTKLMEIEKMRQSLEEKDEELEAIDSLNQTLIIKHRRANDELEDAKKDMISVLNKMSGARSKFGVKRMGELDQKAFIGACKEKKAIWDDKELALLCSEWEYEISQPEWHPFKVIIVDGQEKEIVRDDDEKLRALKEELGDKAHEVVVKALVEMNEYNPSGRYPLPELWNLKKDRKASVSEVAGYLVLQWKAHKKSTHL
ncbi:hypothetical protein PR202_ga12608 [Eleusine coracana subsp. coracana]|uniref:XH/XS domain-containing protein n=2 Tax=Eleusine coracana subsp. coracana TaxID=191504 RepID=A0AAV5CCJ8_ELECO|nr:hypothetical protein PR202_ga12608 [Eleusine coracana subsp. coracana]